MCARIVCPPRIDASFTVASWSGAPRIGVDPEPLWVNDEVRRERGGVRLTQTFVVLEARAGAGDPVPPFAPCRQADDVERPAVAEVGDRARVVHPNPRGRREGVFRPAAERDLLPVDPARGLGDVLD